MRTTAITRAAAFLLSLFLLLGCISCQSKEPAPAETESELRLTVSEEPAVYSEELQSAYTARIAALCARLVRLSKGLVLTETQQQKLSDQISEQLFPTLTEIPVYPNELEALLAASEALCADAESADADDTLLLFFRFYQSDIAVLGSTRTGKLCYRAAEMWLGYQIAFCDERYEKYGYSWYLEDAARYKDQLRRLRTELGEAGCCAAVEILMFGVSLSLGIQPSGNSTGSLSVSAEELVTILQKQAKHFADQELTAAQWSLIAELLTAQTPSGKDALLQAELNALNGDSYFATSANALPSLIMLYKAFADRLTAKDAEEIFLSNDPAARTIGIYRVLSACETEFFAFTSEFEQHAATQSAAEETALQKNGAWEDCQRFLNGTAEVTAEELFAKIKTSANASSEASVIAVEQALTGYLRTQLPYLTYVLQNPSRGAE